MTTVPHPADRPGPASPVPPEKPVVFRVATTGPACAGNETAPAATGASQEMDVNRDKVAPHKAGVNAFAYPLVDPEFVALLPPLTRDQKAGLEKLIVAAGRITSPLIVWAEERLLVDGHHRREIAMRLGMDFRTEEISFPSREAVIEWMFANQRDRRNLTPDQLTLVMGRHYNRAKRSPGNPHLGSQSRQKEEVGTGLTSDRLAADYGVSSTTIERAGRFAAAVDTLRVVDPEIEAKVVTGKGPTRAAVIAAAEKADAAPTEALAILEGNTKPEPKSRYQNEPRETLADKRGFKNLPRRAAQERAEAALMMLETALSNEAPSGSSPRAEGEGRTEMTLHLKRSTNPTNAVENAVLARAIATVGHLRAAVELRGERPEPTRTGYCLDCDAVVELARDHRCFCGSRSIAARTPRRAAA